MLVFFWVQVYFRAGIGVRLLTAFTEEFTGTINGMLGI
jgi:hypothetical protein